MNGASNETRTHSCVFARLAYLLTISTPEVPSLLHSRQKLKQNIIKNLKLQEFTNLYNKEIYLTMKFKVAVCIFPVTLF